MVKELWRTLWRTQTATNAGRIWRLFFSPHYLSSQVSVASCDGKCPSATIYNINVESHLRFCKCCRENGVRNITVPLHCSGNGTEVLYTLQEPVDCTCQWSWARTSEELTQQCRARQHQLVALTQAHDGHTLYNDNVFLTLLELDNLRVDTNCVWFP